MTKMDKPTSLLPPRGPDGRRRARRFGRRAARRRDADRASTAAYAQGAKPPLTPDQLSSYIAVNADGTVSAFFGKMDMGHGLFVAIGQMVAEELDVPFKAVKVYMGDTATSVNQGGASGSTGIQFGGKQMRMAAAEARRVLLEMAAEKLGTPADQLMVVNGMVSAACNRDKKTQLCRADRRQILQRPARLEQADRQRALRPRQGASPRSHTEHKIVGKPIKREDVAPKVFAQEDFVTDIKVPGMVHGRMIRPAVAGQVPVKVDEGSIKDIPGAQGGLGQGLPRRGRRQGMGRDQGAPRRSRSSGRRSNPPFPDQTALYDHIRKAPVRKATGRQAERQRRRGVQNRGARDRGRVRVAVPVACLHGTGLRAWSRSRTARSTCWTGSQKPHFVQRRLAAQLGVPADNVHVHLDSRTRLLRPQRRRRLRGGLRGAGQAVGKPVRLQYSRNEGTGWDPKGPASVHKARAAIDAQGNVTAYEFMSKGFSRIDVNTNGSKLHDTLAGHCARRRAQGRRKLRRAGRILRVRQQEDGMGDHPAAARPRFAAARRASARSGRTADPLRQRILHGRGRGRDQPGPDRIPAEARQGPARPAVIKAAAQKVGWDTRPSPSRSQTGTKVTGRGIAYSQRNGTKVRDRREVEVDRTTGKIWAKKFTVAHDCGQIINPDGLEKCIEGNIIQGISRTLWEEVKFDNKSVTSVDWMTYPILDITETPETIDFALINHPDQPPTGAGEPSIRPVAAAIANAIFDATGVRIRRVPFSPDRVKQALS